MTLGFVGKLGRRPESEQFFRLAKMAKQATLVLSSMQPDAARRKKGRSKPDRVFRHSLTAACLFCSICVAAAMPQGSADTDGKSAGQPRAFRGEDGRILIETDRLSAEVWPNGYVSGVKANSFVDRETGARDGSFGLDIVDFLMGPGAEGGLPYRFGDRIHGNIAKHYVELPQICTQAKHLDAEFVVGQDFVAIRQGWKWIEAAPGLSPGSRWQQTIIFPAGKRYFISSDRVHSVNAVEELFLRIDMPGHIKHRRGDTFEQIYLSYEGTIPNRDFFETLRPMNVTSTGEGRTRSPSE